MKITFPQSYVPADIETKWHQAWQAEALYAYDPSRPRQQTFVIDTPPPTVSGSLHMGHVFSYTQTDVIARYKRMQGMNVFYPIGWDNNGLPTERRVQTLYAIQCDPHIPYELNWQPTLATKQTKGQTRISRQNFLEVCHAQTNEDQQKYKALWQQMGLSFDWQQEYATISPHCRRVAQHAFVQLANKKHVFSKVAPTMWDVTFQTAVALAEVEERPATGNYHDIEFQTEQGSRFIISTTRPELLAACVAVVAHPDDARFQALFGQRAITPLFHAAVPILPAEHADPEKGTGILMVCTFGDTNDVEFWQQQGLPLKAILSRQGRLLAIDFNNEPFTSLAPATAHAAYQQLEGLTVKQARQKMVELLSEPTSNVSGDGPALVAPLKPTEQAVKYYEKGDLPLEFMTTRQWFVDILTHKEALLKQGASINWHPAHMFKRYEQWVQGLNQDWCISRQRFFGVPFPVWYRLDADGEPQYDQPIYADAASLPVDPLSDTPPGFSPEQRGKPNGFIGDPDVMDTWATSSLTPQISSHWGSDDVRHANLYPADLRPQAHEIIRTWAFYTITQSWLHEGVAPWKNITISGWVVNPDKSKMSKSKGNTITPEGLLAQYSADALRYWAARSKLGHDTVYDESVFKIGQKLVTKLINAAKFVLLQLEGTDISFAANGQLEELAQVVMPLDQAWLSSMVQLITTATKAFERFDYAESLHATEAQFWLFCDHYIELVKVRAYQAKTEAAGRSAIISLVATLNIFLRLLAPFIPYVTEEIWSWYFAEATGQRFVHRAPWPTTTEFAAVTLLTGEHVQWAVQVLEAVRGAKSAAQKGLKWPVQKLELETSKKIADALSVLMGDVMAACHVAEQSVSWAVSQEEQLKVNVVLAESE